MDLLGFISTLSMPSLQSWKSDGAKGGGGGGGGGNAGGGQRCRGGGGTLFGWKAHNTLCHTQSSRDISSGFTYSKPSNSDWSIFSMTRLLGVHFFTEFVFVSVIQSNFFIMTYVMPIRNMSRKSGLKYVLQKAVKTNLCYGLYICTD